MIKITRFKELLRVEHIEHYGGFILLPTGKFSEDFEIGYSGQGPYELAHCIIRKGDVEGFLRDVISKIKLEVGKSTYIKDEIINKYKGGEWWFGYMVLWD